MTCGGGTKRRLRHALWKAIAPGSHFSRGRERVVGFSHPDLLRDLPPGSSKVRATMIWTSWRPSLRFGPRAGLEPSRGVGFDGVGHAALHDRRSLARGNHARSPRKDAWSGRSAAAATAACALPHFTQRLRTMKVLGFVEVDDPELVAAAAFQPRRDVQRPHSCQRIGVEIAVAEEEFPNRIHP